LYERQEAQAWWIRSQRSFFKFLKNLLLFFCKRNPRTCKNFPENIVLLFYSNIIYFLLVVLVWAMNNTNCLTSIHSWDFVLHIFHLLD
jgi:hypothetical protein